MIRYYDNGWRRSLSKKVYKKSHNLFFMWPHRPVNYVCLVAVAPSELLHPIFNILNHSNQCRQVDDVGIVSPKYHI